MSIVDSDSDVRLSQEFSTRERQLWLARQRLAEQAAALEAESQRLEAELADAQRQRTAQAKLRTEALVASPPPLPTSAEEEVEEEVPVADAGAFARLTALPGWLISLVVHLIALILLGLWTMPQLLEQLPPTLVVTVAEPEPLEALAEIAVAPPLENVQHQVIDAPSGDLAELSNMTADIAAGEASATTASTDIDAVNVGEMEDLFGSGGTGMKDLGGGKGSAEFFGVKAGGRRFVFVVDSSNSMRGEKFEKAQEELMYAVRRLDKTQAFYVIFFDNDALCMFSDEDQEAEARPVPASTANIRKLEKWLKTVENERRTDPYDAMKIAVEMRPDAIFILSDGQFTDRGQTERYLAENNIIDDPVDGRRPRVVVHTIAFYSRDGEVTMQAIANAYQGTYRFVAPPRRR